jgi:hypothetical protein
VDNHGGDEVEGVCLLMSDRPAYIYPHLVPLITHNLYKGNPRAELGFRGLSTTKSSSYYDYLYIHTSSYANNLSTSEQIRG